MGGLAGHPSNFNQGLEDHTNDQVENQMGILPEKMFHGGCTDLMRIRMNSFYKGAKGDA